MSSGAGKGPQTASILDRLIDDEPDSTHDRPTTETQRLRNFEAAVARDVQSLLNTRTRLAKLPADLTEANNTIVTFGVPDVTSSELRSPRRRNAFYKELEQVLAAFEPRLSSVRIVPLDNVAAEDATLRFRIEAELLFDGTPQQVVFDSMLEPSGPFKIQGEPN